MSASYHHTRRVPHCTPDDVGLTEGEFEPETWPHIQKYFAQFDAPRRAPLAAAPYTPAHCTCGVPLSGLTGSYVELVPGEGECCNCHRPVRLWHTYTRADGELEMDLRYPLLYRREK